jgi:hypothetical protein
MALGLWVLAIGFNDLIYEQGLTFDSSDKQ